MRLNRSIDLGLPDGRQLTVRVLTVGDNEEIDSWVFQDITARELALRILRRQIIDAPPGFQLDAATDAALAQLVAQWMHASLAQEWPDASVTNLSVLKRRLREHYQRERDKWRAIAERMIGADVFRNVADVQRSIAQTLAPLSANFAAIHSALAPINQMAPLIAQFESVSAAFQPMAAFADQLTRSFATTQMQLPNLTALSSTFSHGVIGAGQELLTRFYAIREEAAIRLEEHHMRFAAGILPISVSLRLTQVKDPSRAHSVLASLGLWLRSSEFYDDLMESMQGFGRSRQRIAIVRDALKAHSERRYSLSVPVFISQAEGMLTDFLVQSRLVRRAGARVYAVDPGSGAIKLDRNGDKVQLLGWDRKLQSARTTANAVMDDLATDLVGFFIPQRNAILHGHALRYAEHKQSAYALLVGAVTARALADL